MQKTQIFNVIILDRSKCQIWKFVWKNILSEFH